MQTLIIILIVVMIINDILDIGVYYKNHLYKQKYLLLQEIVKKTQSDFFAQKQRYEKIIDEYKETIRNLTYKCDTQAIRINGLEEERTIIINGDIKGTDTDGVVKVASPKTVDNADFDLFSHISDTEAFQKFKKMMEDEK